MRWYEYKMEVEDLHASEDLKAKLMAMQKTASAAPEKATPAEAPKQPRKRPIRFPSRVILGVAACAAVCVVGLGAVTVGRASVSLLSAGSADSTAAAMFYSTAEAPKAALAYDSGEYSLEASADTNGLDSGTLSANSSARSEQGEAKIIYTANLSIESKDYEAARDALNEAVTAAGGYIESSNESAYTESNRSLSLTLRIPQENYESFLAAAAEAGNLVNKNQQAEDVTSSYMDIEARLNNLIAQRTRLQELQAGADNLSDLLEIESSLSDVQYQIESWQSQLDWYSDQVECSTVYVYLNEVEEYTETGDETFLSRIADAFGDGWDNFLSFAVGLVAAWPVILIVAVVIVVFAVWRCSHRKSKNI